MSALLAGIGHRLARDVVYPVARRSALRDLVLFESWGGKTCSDNPRALYDQLVLERTGHELAWSCRPGTPAPAGATRVTRYSPDHYRALAQARWVVSNDMMPAQYRKRPESRYLQTWHGTPLKRLAFDVADLKVANRDYLAEFAEEVRRWDALVSPSSFATEKFRAAFRYSGDVLETGYPRNDALADPARRRQRRALAREALGVPPAAPVVLYAPTWREDQHVGTSYRFGSALDLGAMAAGLATGTVLLVRGHHLTAGDVRVPRAENIVDASAYPEMTDLLAAADVLVTDYSSSMFDFATTGRPMVFFTPDLADYRDRLRGLYLDPATELPGPLVDTTDDVVSAVAEHVDAADRAHARYESFWQRFCSLEDGHASERVLRRFGLSLPE